MSTLEKMEALLDKYNNIDRDLVITKYNELKSKYDINEVYGHLAKVCGFKSDNIEWSLLAGKLLLMSIDKGQKLLDIITLCKKQLSPAYYEFCIQNLFTLEGFLVKERDDIFDLFGASTLIKSYLLKYKKLIGNRESLTPIELPQYMFLRTAIQLWMPIDGKPELGESLRMIKKVYDDISTRNYIHASPTLYNSGLVRNQMASCFLMTVNDNMEHISDTWKYCGIISKNSGGIGLDVSDIRHSEIGQVGKSEGIVPLLKVYNYILKYADQGGRRPGSGTIFIPPYHKDVYEFIDLKKNTGKEDLRARDLFYSLWVPDLFMKRVAAREKWSLFCPNIARGLNELYGEEFEIKYEEYEKLGYADKTVDALELMEYIIRAQIETGMPFMVYKDAVNRKTNQMNLGTIRCSNLCVSGDTLILTNEGYKPIRGCSGNTVTVWNGKNWSRVNVVQTGVQQEMIQVSLSDGTRLKCTPYHKFYNSQGKDYMAYLLLPGTELIKWKLPNDNEIQGSKLDSAFTEGYITGLNLKDTNKLVLHTNDLHILPELDFTVLKRAGNEYHVTLTCEYYSNTVPLTASYQSRVLWLYGFIAANNNSNVLMHQDYKTLYNVKLLLQTLGFHSVLTSDCGLTLNNYYKLVINDTGILHYVQKYSSKKNNVLTHDTLSKIGEEISVTVTSVTRLDTREDTWCFKEPERGMGVFNGVLTGQCQEILEYTSKKEIASCNLSSIILSNFVCDKVYNFDALGSMVEQVVYNLNQVIDRNYYPKKIPEIKYANLKNRPIGIGVQDLASTFFLMDYTWESDEARKLNRDIFETIYYHAIKASIELAIEHGTYESYNESPMQRGLFQFDLWNMERLALNPKSEHDVCKYFEQHQDDNTRYNWTELRDHVKQHGLRNSLLVALMPTASTAQIMRSTECYEPVTANIFARKVLSGQFIVLNQYLINDLKELGLWNRSTMNNIIRNDGSIQNLPTPKHFSIEQRRRLFHIRNKYKTVYEIPQRILLDMAIDRGHFVCQTQSQNTYMDSPEVDRVYNYHMYGWEHGIKTGMYYLRTKSAVGAIKMIDDESEEVCESCSA